MSIENPVSAATGINRRGKENFHTAFLISQGHASMIEFGNQKNAGHGTAANPAGIRIVRERGHSRSVMCRLQSVSCHTQPHSKM